MARRELQKRHTFAAPVEINGIRGNMAAVVQLTGKNHYHTHRIIMPDGSAFAFNAEKNTESKPAVAANLRVALLQPTAYVRAAAVLDYKYLAAAFGDRMGTRQATAEMLKHSGIALWKDMGFLTRTWAGPSGTRSRARAASWRTWWTSPWRRRNWKTVGRAYQAYVVSALAAAVVESLADALRDDDDDTLWEKLWNAFGGLHGNLASDLNPLNKLPYLREVFNAIDDQDNGRMDAEGKTVSGSLKAKYIAYIQSMGLTPSQQKAMWLALKNSTWSDKGTPWE